VRLKVETIAKAVVVPSSAVQRGPAGTFSYVIGDGDIVTAKPVVVTQQNEMDAVIASGLSASDRVVTTGFANLSDGAKVVIGRDEQTPTADLAPRKKRSSRDGQAKDGQAKDPQAKDPQAKDGQGERRGKKGEHGQGEGDQKGQTGPAAASEQSGGAAKSQP
jgi:multidrug efflux system membrane fusion protein